MVHDPCGHGLRMVESWVFESYRSNVSGKTRLTHNNLGSIGLAAVLTVFEEDMGVLIRRIRGSFNLSPTGLNRRSHEGNSDITSM